MRITLPLILMLAGAQAFASDPFDANREMIKRGVQAVMPHIDDSASYLPRYTALHCPPNSEYQDNLNPFPGNKIDLHTSKQFNINQSAVSNSSTHSNANQ